MGVPLVESKLSRPRLRARDRRPRPRVTAALERAAEHGVVLVSAPAGYGKTVAVAAWLRDRRAGLGVARRGRQRPGAAVDVRRRGARRGAAGAGRWRPRSTALARPRAAARARGRARAQRSRVPGDARARRAGVRPARADHPRRPADPAGRGCAREGALGEVRADDAGLHRREAALVLGGRRRRARDRRPHRGLAGRGVPRRAVAARRRRRRTPARRTTSRSTSPPRCSTGSTAGARVPRAHVGAPRACRAELCDHVLEIDDSADRLDALVAREPVRGRARRPRGWFRYHDLFRELLRRDARRRRRPRRCTAAPPTWFLARGRIEEAVEHAHAAGDHATVAAARRHAPPALLRTGRGATFVRWLAELPEHELAEWPAPARWPARWPRRARARPRDEVRRLLAAAERARTPTRDAGLCTTRPSTTLVVGRHQRRRRADGGRGRRARGRAEHERAGDERRGDEPRAETRWRRSTQRRRRARRAQTRGGGRPPHEASVLVVTRAVRRSPPRGCSPATRRTPCSAAVAAIGHPTASRRPHGFACALATLAIVRADQGRVAAGARARRPGARDRHGLRQRRGAHGRAGARRGRDRRARLKGVSGARSAPASARSALLPPGALRARVRLVLARIHARRGELPPCRGRARAGPGTCSPTAATRASCPGSPSGSRTSSPPPATARSPPSRSSRSPAPSGSCSHSSRRAHQRGDRHRAVPLAEHGQDAPARRSTASSACTRARRPWPVRRRSGCWIHPGESPDPCLVEPPSANHPQRRGAHALSHRHRGHRRPAAARAPGDVRPSPPTASTRCSGTGQQRRAEGCARPAARTRPDTSRAPSAPRLTEHTTMLGVTTRRTYEITVFGRLGELASAFEPHRVRSEGQPQHRAGRARRPGHAVRGDRPRAGARARAARGAAGV